LGFIQDYEAAAEAVLRAHALYPQDYYIYRHAAKTLGIVGRWEELRRIVEEMLARFPERWEAWIDAGFALGELGEWDRACEVSRQALQVQPHSSTVWMLHGGLLTAAGRLREAIAVLERGWDLRPAGQACWPAAGGAWGLAQCYRALGEEAPARQWLEEMARVAREEATFDPAGGYHELGRALEALGDVPGAIQAYQSALDHHLMGSMRQEVEEALARLRGNA
jgi:tetratricopeptide (TPR) repeat protein